MLSFHSKCGNRVTLLNNNRTAIRSDCEFNHGIVLSAEPLEFDYLFEVQIDKKIHSWSGNIEIGVAVCDPDNMELPASAISLRNGSWIMSGNSILKDGQRIKQFYGCNLDTLNEGDRLGVMRTALNELVIYINGVSQGVAVENLPLAQMHAVVDMYGKCVQITVLNNSTLEHNNDDFLSCGDGSALTLDNEVTGMSMSLGSNLSELSLDLRQDWNVHMNIPSEAEANKTNNTSFVPVQAQPAPENVISPRDRLRFHIRCGSLVKLTSNFRSAERRRPLDEFNNGVVMTSRPLYDDELFEIRIDRLVEKWSGSIEVGVTTHNPGTLEFPATMTNMRSGTIMMSGCGILTNGKGTRREYGEFNLDELREGDRVGMMRKSNGNLHYFINGLDQGIAASKVAHHVWGVIDLYGMTIKVTIVDRDERESQNLITRRNTKLRGDQNPGFDTQCSEIDCYDRLMFHTVCGTHADVINNGRTAHRPNAADDFNNGVVLTARPLKLNELFEVRLDKVVPKWAGSIEIGVTTHAPTDLEFPFTMTNVRSGTWMMTGNGVMHNGTTIIDRYGQNLDRLQVGDRVGVVRKESGILHFFVNGIDQGPAATNVPERVYGVIDLYGQAAQATIHDALDFFSPDTAVNSSSVSNTMLYSDLRFHHIHGKNARISNNGLTASRPRAFGEFNDAIVFSSRPLREEELFEISLDKVVDRWSGSIELGVSEMRPEELELPSTATDLDHDTYMLSGSVVMENGINLKAGYVLDLDTLTANSRVGVMRHSDGMLHFYLNGVDQGPACYVASSSVYAVVDLYGQCAQVTLVVSNTNNGSGDRVGGMGTLVSPNDEPGSLQASIVHNPATGAAPPLDSYFAHKLSDHHGKNISLSQNNTIATRSRDSSNCLVFSSHPLSTDEIFEIELLSILPQFAGSIKVGITSININDPKFAVNIPTCISAIGTDSWYVTGNEIYAKSRMLSTVFCPSLDWLRVGDKIGIKRASDATLRILINCEEMAVIANNIPDGVYAVISLFGRVNGIRVISFKTPPLPLDTTRSVSMSPLTSFKLHDSLELVLDPPSHQYTTGRPDVTDATDIESISETDRFEFYENHGRNIEILPNRTTARRVASYNQGVVVVGRPIIKGQPIEVKIEKINEKWTSSLMLGIVCVPLSKINFSVTALQGFKKHCWIICSDWLSINGVKIKSNYGSILDQLKVGDVVGLLLSETGRLSLSVNGVNMGPLPAGLPLTSIYHAIFDLYGQCEQISILNSNQCMESVCTLSGSSAVAMGLAGSQTDGEAGDDVEVVEEKQTEENQASNSKVDNQQCEKADLESHEKETEAGDLPMPEPTIVNTLQAVAHSLYASTSRRCDYLKECIRIKNSLVLPEEYFTGEDPICYCSSCYDTYEEELDVPKGSDQNVPIGWTKFLLKKSGVSCEGWHEAFYGAKLNIIRCILDRRQPLTKEQLKFANFIFLPVENGESTSSQIEFSPNVESVMDEVKFVETDKRSKRKIEIMSAFQILVRPGSYSVTQGSDDDSVMTSSTSSTNNCQQWYTKETGAIVLHSLLFKLNTF